MTTLREEITTPAGRKAVLYGYEWSGLPASVSGRLWTDAERRHADDVELPIGEALDAIAEGRMWDLKYVFWTKNTLFESVERPKSFAKHTWTWSGAGSMYAPRRPAAIDRIGGGAYGESTVATVSTEERDW